MTISILLRVILTVLMVISILQRTGSCSISASGAFIGHRAALHGRGADLEACVNLFKPGLPAGSGLVITQA
jgi:hypothetical protein